MVAEHRQHPMAASARRAVCTEPMSLTQCAYSLPCEPVNIVNLFRPCALPPRPIRFPVISEVRLRFTMFTGIGYVPRAP